MAEDSTESPRWVKPDDVRGRWLGAALSVEDEALTKLLLDAEDALIVAVPDLADRVEDDRVPLARIRRVAVRIAIRVLRNPQGYRQVATGTGPFTGSATFGGDEPGEIYVTAEDRRDLLGTPVRRPRRAFSIFPGGVR